jgi:hypothetical protein
MQLRDEGTGGVGLPRIPPARRGQRAHRSRSAGPVAFVVDGDEGARGPGGSRDAAPLEERARRGLGVCLDTLGALSAQLLKQSARFATVNRRDECGPDRDG